MKNVILIGMPGCGKTTIGELIATELGLSFFDTDQEIEKNSHMTISQIFEMQGEDSFRQLETKTLSSLSKKDNSIIATGGGIVERQKNLEILKNCDIVIFINRPLENIINDIRTEDRPLLANNVSNLTRLYERRLSLYKEACTMEISNDKSTFEVAEKIINEVTKLWQKN